MTRKGLLNRIWYSVLGLVCYGFLGVLIEVNSSELYQLYKDLLPLAIAVPGAYLGYAFQRRMSYLQALRELWKQLIPAVQQAIQFTQLSPKTKADYRLTTSHLYIVIDSLRGVFANVPTPGTMKGLYPYENLKDILKVVEWLGWDKPRREEEVEQAQLSIMKLWQEMHTSMLYEFDRHPPIIPVSKYFHTGTSIADKLISGNLNESDLTRESSASHPPSEHTAKP